MNKLLLGVTFLFLSALSTATEEKLIPGDLIEASINTANASKFVELKCKPRGVPEQYELHEGPKGWVFEVLESTKTGCAPGYYLAVVSESRLLLFLGANPRPTYRAMLGENNI